MGAQSIQEVDMDKNKSDEYLKIGFQYYVSARAASFGYLLPVAGNLYHHALEMLLKYLLIGELSPKNLKDRFGHNLEKLWKEYKLLKQDKTISKYNSLIKKLNKFEDLRYPSNKGYSIFIDFRKKYYSYQKQEPTRNDEEYRINLEQIDELVSVLLKDRTSEGWIKGLVFHGSAREVYEKENLHSLLGKPKL